MIYMFNNFLKYIYLFIHIKYIINIFKKIIKGLNVKMSLFHYYLNINNNIIN